MMFVGINDANQVLWRYVILKDFPNDELLRENIIAKVRGKVTQVRDGIGDIEVTDVELVRDISDIVETVNSHWEDFSAELLKKTNSSIIDGMGGDPYFNQKTREVVISHNVGNMQPTFQGGYLFEPEVRVNYLVNLDGKITRIFLQYRQVK
jgi:hypothetical protein